jgi:hypothetical protein
MAVQGTCIQRQCGRNEVAPLLHNGMSDYSALHFDLYSNNAVQSAVQTPALFTYLSLSFLEATLSACARSLMISLPAFGSHYEVL